MGDPGVSDVYWRGFRRFERSDSPLLHSQLMGLTLLPHRRMVGWPPRFARSDPLRGIPIDGRIGGETRDTAIGKLAIPLAILDDPRHRRSACWQAHVLLGSLSEFLLWLMPRCVALSMRWYQEAAVPVVRTGVAGRGPAFVVSSRTRRS